jgi:NAD(P)-dependent dehydrogenase (short-subunit alcohol dehydrogenase family)
MASSWRTQLKPFGIGVTLIQPGFVKTPLTDKNNFYMPFLIDSDTAAEVFKRLRSRIYLPDHGERNR